MSTEQEVKLLLEQVKSERAEIRANGSQIEADGWKRQASLLKWLLPTFFAGLVATGGIVLQIAKLMIDKQ